MKTPGRGKKRPALTMLRHLAEDLIAERLGMTVQEARRTRRKVGRGKYEYRNPTERKEGSRVVRRLIKLGPVLVRRSSGRLPLIARLYIPKASYCCDLTVHFGKVVEHGLYDDPKALRSINTRLFNLGYRGPALPRAELGMQDERSRYIVLEATHAFDRWAAKTCDWDDLNQEREDRARPL